MSASVCILLGPRQNLKYACILENGVSLSKWLVGVILFTKRCNFGLVNKFHWMSRLHWLLSITPLIAIQKSLSVNYGELAMLVIRLAIVLDNRIWGECFLGRFISGSNGKLIYRNISCYTRKNIHKSLSLVIVLRSWIIWSIFTLSIACGALNLELAISTVQRLKISLSCCRRVDDLMKNSGNWPETGRKCSECYRNYEELLSLSQEFFSV